MKKILTAILALVTVITLCACSGGKTPADTAEKTSALTENVKPGETQDPGADTKVPEQQTSPSENSTEPAQAAGSEGLDIKVYDDGCEVRDIGTFTGTELIIPSHVDGIPVTHIDEDAISNDTMISLFIPWTVKSIGEDAVSESHNLETVTFSEGLISLGLGSFGGCPKLTAVTLPSTLERIGQSAFTNCAALTEVTVNGNADVKKYAFTECPALKKVTFTGKSERAYSLDTYAFEFEKSLEEIKLSEGLETIGSYCFSNCESLGTVYLPASLKKIETGAFSEVGSLKIFYSGSEEQWNAITVGNGNEALLDAEITYNYR